MAIIIIISDSKFWFTLTVEYLALSERISNQFVFKNQAPGKRYEKGVR